MNSSAVSCIPARAQLSRVVNKFLQFQEAKHVNCLVAAAAAEVAAAANEHNRKRTFTNHADVMQNQHHSVDRDRRVKSSTITTPMYINE